MKELVIKIKYGGLGDHLLYSPIPRISKQIHGYKKVYISNFSDYRNPKTKELVWQNNPFVDGFVDVDAPIPTFSVVENGKNILDTLADFVGLPDDGIRFREPEIYYIPKKIEYLKDSVIYDPNFLSKVKHPNASKVMKYFLDNNIRIDYQMKLLPNYSSHSYISDLETLSSNGLEIFCDIIYSCKIFYCLTSGSATLAASIGKSSVVLYEAGVNSMFHHSKLHEYVQI